MAEKQDETKLNNGAVHSNTAALIILSHTAPEPHLIFQGIAFIVQPSSRFMEAVEATFLMVVRSAQL